MTQTSTVVYKTGVLGNGGFHQSLCEYISRECRFELVQLSIKKIAEYLDEIREEYGASPGRPISPSTFLASKMGVSYRTVNNWISGRMQGSNINIQRLLEVAFQLAPVDAVEILYKDFEVHRKVLETIDTEVLNERVIGKGAFLI